MSTETGELAVGRPLFDGAVAPHAPAEPLPVWGAHAEAERPLRSGAHTAAMQDSWCALWSSRMLVWLAGIAAVAAFGYGPARKVIQHAALTHGFGSLGDLLVAPAARWDAGWYLLIAHQGYDPGLGAATAARGAFFPLYPLLVRALSVLLIAPVLAGIAVSVLALAVALYLLHRLAALETGSREVARLAVMATAFAPMAFILSAVYSESLYLALSVGAFWFARKGRWAATGALGGLAAATRPTGLLLLAPALILYLYGPRRDRPPDAPRTVRQDAATTGRLAGALARARPRYRVRMDVLWLGLIPAGIALFAAYLVLAGGDAAAPFHSQALWGRHFAGPFGGLWSGAVAAFEGLRQLLSGQDAHSYFAHASGSPLVSASHNVLLFAFAIATAVAVVGVVRTLPFAYGAYVLLALALPLSYPVTSEPLMSLPRFVLVLFPLFIWLGRWFEARPRARAPALALSATSLVFFTGAFATWHWVA